MYLPKHLKLLQRVRNPNTLSYRKKEEWILLFKLLLLKELLNKKQEYIYNILLWTNCSCVNVIISFVIIGGFFRLATTFIKAKLKKSDDQMNIDKY